MVCKEMEMTTPELRIYGRKKTVMKILRKQRKLQISCKIRKRDNVETIMNGTTIGIAEENCMGQEIKEEIIAKSSEKNYGRQ